MLLEGTVIVASILLAFGIDAWWDARQYQVEEIEVLAGLEQEFIGNAAYFERRLQHHQIALAAVGKLLNAAKSGFWDDTIGPVDDSLILLLIPPTTDLGQGVRDSLVSSGRLELLSNNELRDALAAWEGVLDEVLDDELMSREWVFEQVIPYLAQRGISLSQAFSIDVGAWPVPTESMAEREDAMAQLWSDPVFETLLQTRYWSLAHTTPQYEESLRAAQEILDEIEQTRSGGDAK